MPTRLKDRDLTEPVWRYICDEHEVFHPETGEYLFTVTADDLQKAAEKGNARIQATGDYTPITLGHTRDNTSEKDQPEIVGYGGPFMVGPLWGTGRKAILALTRYFKDRQKDVDRHPRTSVEVTWSDHLIDPIALLGATTPARDLGLAYSHGSVRTSSVDPSRWAGLRFRYEMSPPAPPPVEEEESMALSPEAIAEVIKALEQTAPWKWMQAKMEQEEAGGEPGEEQPPAPAMSGAEEDQEYDAGGTVTASPSSTNVNPPSSGGMNMPERRAGMEHHLKHAKAFHRMAMDHIDNGDDDAAEEMMQYASRCMQRYKGEGALDVEHQGPATEHFGEEDWPDTDPEDPELTMPPLDEDDMPPAPPAPPRKPEKMRMHKEQQAIRQRRASVSDKAKEEEIRALRLRLSRVERERDLVQLEAEGIEFDRAEELDAVAGMTDEQYTAHLKRMKTRYSRAGLGGEQIRTSSSTGGRAPSSKERGAASISGNADLRDRAVAYATQAGVSYDAALKHVTNGTT